jgi:hypothetical protein
MIKNIIQVNIKKNAINISILQVILLIAIVVGYSSNKITLIQNSYKNYFLFIFYSLILYIPIIIFLILNGIVYYRFLRGLHEKIREYLAHRKEQSEKQFILVNFKNSASIVEESVDTESMAEIQKKILQLLDQYKILQPKNFEKMQKSGLLTVKTNEHISIPELKHKCTEWKNDQKQIETEVKAFIDNPKEFLVRITEFHVQIAAKLNIVLSYILNYEKLTDDQYNSLKTQLTKVQKKWKNASEDNIIETLLSLYDPTKSEIVEKLQKYVLIEKERNHIEQIELEIHNIREIIKRIKKEKIGESQNGKKGKEKNQRVKKGKRQIQKEQQNSIVELLFTILISTMIVLGGEKILQGTIGIQSGNEEIFFIDPFLIIIILLILIIIPTILDYELPTRLQQTSKMFYGQQILFVFFILLGYNYLVDFIDLFDQSIIIGLYLVFLGGLFVNSQKKQIMTKFPKENYQLMTNIFLFILCYGPFFLLIMLIILPIAYYENFFSLWTLIMIIIMIILSEQINYVRKKDNEKRAIEIEPEKTVRKYSYSYYLLVLCITLSMIDKIVQ